MTGDGGFAICADWQGTDLLQPDLLPSEGGADKLAALLNEGGPSY